jgi:gliding motility-associated-like protein
MRIPAIDMRLSLIVLFTQLFSAIGFGQSHPEVLCASVTDSGVEITWSELLAPPPNTNYLIHQNGVQIGSVLHPANQFTDAAANADAGPVDYFVLTEGVVPATPVNTVSTIFLELIPTGSTSIAQLEWTLPFENMPADGSFSIERREVMNPPQNFEIIADNLPTTTQFYLDTLYGVCDETTFSYRINFQRPECSMLSNEVSGEFEDDIPPPVPINAIASVDPFTGEITMIWDPVNVPDFQNYFISQRNPDGNFINTDVPVEDGEEFTLPGNEGQNGSVVLGVVAKDSCDLDQSFGDTVRTMFAQASYQDCGQTVSVRWNRYEGWTEGVQNYEVRAILDSGADDLLEIFPAGQAFYDVELDIEPNVNYRFYVLANLNGTQSVSTSNGVPISTDYPRIIDFHYLSSVSTTLENEILVTLLQDTLGVGTTYELYRAENDLEYEFVGSFIPQSGQDTIRYLDGDVSPTQNFYTYFWRAFDGCGVLIGDSNESTNIILSTRSPQNDLENQLFWNAYQGWDGQVSQYEVFRGETLEELFPFDATFPGDLDYVDNIEDLLLTEGRFCYRIAAVETNNSYGDGAVSFSNVSCITQAPIIWIPDAMVYEGFNDEWKPVLGFIDFETYRMEIYNKWGERLFETNEITEAWDGTYKGSVVREDYYRYIMTFKDGSGQPYIEEGRLYMIRNSN